ncbi:CDC45-like protein [Gonapodya prolifera JEL478]|uniref:CDC45-like protein n=1 Tax=Gonapodya prolifera (strain JEL478) TaxID=1344416 RepID=A0A139AGK8_GONPJ|nr:CDC45-like protein [Gonapodya prolifera JEL478]|eukprot:KXS15936.1 CDC45-like protein [Gonapodya prolifera JEL478]
MPVFTAAQFERVYADIRRHGSAPDAAPALIFASNDVDAVCACKIVVSLLSADNIRHTVIPVSSYTDLSSANESRVAGKDDLRSIILINCGSLVASAEIFDLPHPDTRVYVVDTHRPCNLRNLWGEEQVVVFVEEDFESAEMVEIREAYAKLEYDHGGDSDSDADSDSERGDDDNHERRTALDGEAEDDEARRALQDDEDGAEGVNGRLGDAEDEEAGDENKENEGDPDAPHTSPSRKRRRDSQSSPSKRPRHSTPPAPRLSRAARRRERARLRDILASYYTAGTWHSGSVAALWCDMVWGVGRGGNDELWLALVGLTHLLLHHRVSPRSYEHAMRTKWTGLAAPLNIPSMGGPTTGAGAGTGLDRPSLGGTGAGLVRTDEFRFCLWRHWNLFDSMAHSEYVAVKLGLWNVKGRRRMSQMLAKMGFSLSEVRQPTTSMSPNLKSKLTSSLPPTARDFGLDDLLYPSFARRFGTRGHKATLSAADAAMALDALLDGGKGWARRNERGDVVVEQRVQSGIVEDEAGAAARGEAKSWRDIEAQNVGVGTGKETGMEGVVRREETFVGRGAKGTGEGGDNCGEWMENFFAAFDALSNVDILRQGILIARHLQTATVRAATTLLDKNALKTMRNFRLAVLGRANQASAGLLSGTNVGGSGRIGQADYALFGRNPSWLESLGNMLLMSLKEWSRHKTDLPFVIAAFNTESDSYLVCGFPSKGKNPFGLAFQEAASNANAIFKQDFFEAHVVEVKREDFSRLLEQLQRQRIST